MNRFKKKAILKNPEEWYEEYQRTRGGDGFPMEWNGSYPVLVLETDNPLPASQRTLFTDKLYVFIERDDILALIG